MMVKLYVNWENAIILNEKQAEETMKNEYYPSVASRDNFNEWLCENYDYAELFDMNNEDEKKTIRANFMEEMKETAWNDFIADGYEEVSVEI